MCMPNPDVCDFSFGERRRSSVVHLSNVNDSSETAILWNRFLFVRCDSLSLQMKFNSGKLRETKNCTQSQLNNSSEKSIHTRTWRHALFYHRHVER